MIVRLLAVLLLLLPGAARADGFLRTDGSRIVDARGRPVLLRGVGLGGWMLQEGYMLRLGDVGQQHRIRAKLAELVGPERTAAFYRAWLDNYVVQADVDAIAAAGFNSIRLPLHYDLLTLPVEQEPAPGRDTWLPEGFARVDRLVAWAKEAGLYVVLDLHAAPGGQGTDLPIADRDPAKPSLWDSPENRAKTVALWRELARRYADEPTVGAFDLINEPNWDFSGPGGGHGCQEKANAPLRAHLREITAAIRAVDKRHMLVIEGNCWGNNYAGVLPLWDGNTMLSVHKYWNRNDPASIADWLRLRRETNAPVWLGETGENSNGWYRDVVRLAEGENIGWAFWPWKKMGFNQPSEVVPNPGWARIVAWMTGVGRRPSRREAEAALTRLATRDIVYANTVKHPDVVDALLRQPHDDSPRPFVRPGRTVQAVDYDLGPPGVAYQDKVDANYHVATGGERVEWNPGRTYRNDGVDIARGKDGRPYVTDFVPGEWLRYTIDARAGDRLVLVAGASGGRLSVAVDGARPIEVALPPAGGWRPVAVPGAKLGAGRHAVIVRALAGTNRLLALKLER